MKNATLPIVLIVLGSLLLLNSLDLIPSMRWLWVMGLIIAGVVVLAADGLTSSSIVVGPLLILAGILQFLRLQYGLTYSLIIPILMISLGILLLLARSGKFPDQRS